jgi:hypothetical protein
LAKTALEQVNKVEAKQEVVEGKQKVEVDNTILENLDTLIQQVKEQVQALNQQLEEIGVERKVETVLQIEAKSEDGTQTTSSEVTVPSELFTKAQENGVDKIAITSDVAKVSINPSVIGDRAGATVSLSVEVVSNDTLSEEIRNIVGDNKVYDFNLFIGEDRISSFNEPVEISLPYTPVEGEDPKFATVFFVDDDGSIQQMKGKYNPETGTLDFKTRHFSFYMPVYNKVTFVDLNRAEWSREMVEELASKGIVSGMGNGRFEPNENLTRAQFVTLVLNAFDVQLVEASSASFSDVGEGDWFYSQVHTAFNEGIIRGRSAQEFAPNAQISRQDMTVIIKNAWEKYVGTLRADGEYLRVFEDRREAQVYALDAIAASVRLGLIRGRGDGTFDPTGNATRAEAAVVINRLFNLI